MTPSPTPSEGEKMLPTASAMQTALRYMQSQASIFDACRLSVSGAGEAVEIYRDAIKCIEFAHASAQSSSGVRDREALRKLAIKQHVRMAQGGGYLNNGKSCELCKGSWDDDAPERHGPSCPAALSPDTPREGEK